MRKNSPNDRELLLQATRTDNVAELQNILSRQDSTEEAIDNNTDALAMAARLGHIESVKLLIPFSNPKEDGGRALREAAEYGQLDIVKILIPLSTPSYDNSSALREAAENDHIEVVKALIPVSNVDQAIKVMFDDDLLTKIDALIPHIAPRSVEKLVKRAQREKNHMKRMPRMAAMLLKEKMEREVQAPTHEAKSRMRM